MVNYFHGYKGIRPNVLFHWYHIEHPHPILKIKEEIKFKYSVTFKWFWGNISYNSYKSFWEHQT